MKKLDAIKLLERSLCRQGVPKIKVARLSREKSALWEEAEFNPRWIQSLAKIHAKTIFSRPS